MLRKMKPIAAIGWNKGLSVMLAALTTLLAGQAVKGADGLNVRRSRVTGLASFVTPDGGGSIPVRATARSGKVTPRDFLNQYKRLFGVTAPAIRLSRIL